MSRWSRIQDGASPQAARYLPRNHRAVRTAPEQNPDSCSQASQSLVAAYTLTCLMVFLLRRRALAVLRDQEVGGSNPLAPIDISRLT
jgi:hypothetical protein